MLSFWAWCMIEVRGAWCPVPGARCVVCGAWCMVHGACCVMCGSWCVVHRASCVVLDTWRVLGVIGATHPVCDVGCMWCVCSAWCTVVRGAWCGVCVVCAACRVPRAACRVLRVSSLSPRWPSPLARVPTDAIERKTQKLVERVATARLDTPSSSPEQGESPRLIPLLRPRAIGPAVEKHDVMTETRHKSSSSATPTSDASDARPPTPPPPPSADSKTTLEGESWPPGSPWLPPPPTPGACPRALPPGLAGVGRSSVHSRHNRVLYKIAKCT